MECKKVALRMNSSHPGSLGLHPIVYFYSELGRHKPASFYAVTALILQFEKEDSFIPFTEIRADFETLLLSYDYLIQQIVRKYRAALPSYPRIRDFFMECIDKLYAHRSKGEESDGLIARVIEEITREPKYEYLTHADHDVAATGKDFSTETKSAAFIREALGGAPHCGICGGYIHRNSIQIDHIVRRADGGLGTLDNAQLAHPFCNSTYKG
jgi:hypothetical protein